MISGDADDVTCFRSTFVIHVHLNRSDNEVLVPSYRRVSFLRCLLLLFPGSPEGCGDLSWWTDTCVPPGVGLHLHPVFDVNESRPLVMFFCPPWSWAPGGGDQPGGSSAGLQGSGQLPSFSRRCLPVLMNCRRSRLRWFLLCVQRRRGGSSCQDWRVS